jgi:hypothetical protein
VFSSAWGLAAGGGAASPSVLAPVTKNLPVLVRYATINQQKTRRCGMPSFSIKTVVDTKIIA